MQLFTTMISTMMREYSKLDSGDNPREIIDLRTRQPNGIAYVPNCHVIITTGYDLRYVLTGSTHMRRRNNNILHSVMDLNGWYPTDARQKGKKGWSC